MDQAHQVKDDGSTGGAVSAAGPGLTSQAQRAAPLLAMTDFSSGARHAVERAAMLAHEARSPLHVLHVVPAGALDRLRTLLEPGAQTEVELIQDAERRLRSVLDHLSEEDAPELRMSLRVGQVLREIEIEADAACAQLVVVGAHGEGILRRLALGTTAERLLRIAKRPVLIVKQRPRERYRRVLVPVDFSAASVNSIRLARQFAPGADLLMLHAYDVPFEGRMRLGGADSQRIETYREQTRRAAHQRLNETAAAAGLGHDQWRACVVMKDPSLAIREQELDADCDLIVMGKHGTGMLADFLLGSVTKHTLSECSCDVLVSTERQDRS